MTEIIRGGAYQRADGTWVNAKGKPIPAPKGDVYKREEVEETKASEEDLVTPGDSGVDDFGSPPETVKPKKSRKTH